MRYLSLGIIISPVCVSCQVNEKTIHALYKVENNRSYSIISLLACLSLSSPQSKSSKFKKLRKHTKLMKFNFPLLWFVYVYHCSIASPLCRFNGFPNNDDETTWSSSFRHSLKHDNVITTPEAHHHGGLIFPSFLLLFIERGNIALSISSDDHTSRRKIKWFLVVTLVYALDCLFTAIWQKQKRTILLCSDSVSSFWAQSCLK